MQRTRDYYQALGFAPVSLGALRRGAVHAAGQAAGAVARGADHHGRALPAGRRRPGAGREVQRRRQVLQGLLRLDRDDPRSAHLARRLRPRAHHGRGPAHVAAAGRAAAGGEGRADRRAHAALPRGADQPQPAGDDGDRRARAARGAAARTAPTWRSSSPADRCVTRP